MRRRLAVNGSSRRALIDVALGNEFADMCIVGGELVNVATGEIYAGGVAVKGDRIAAVGDVDYTRGPSTHVVDANGKYITPGLIDTHLHCYHSYLGVGEFAQLLLSGGVTATADGFYGQGIVGGRSAVEFFKAAFEATPLRLIFLVPVLAWLQNRSLGLTPTAGISEEDMVEMLDWDGCRGLEEPPYMPIVDKMPQLLALFEETLARGKTITGHAAGITARQLQAYVAMGAYTDHESTDCWDGLAKIRAGLKLLVREGSVGLDTAELSRLATEFAVDTRTLAYCTDVASAEKMAETGTVDGAVRVAIRHGIPAIKAIQMATLNAAEVFGLQHEIGVLAPGRYADIVLVNDLARFDVQEVFVGGRAVVESGAFSARIPPTMYPPSFYETVKLGRPLVSEDLLARTSRSDSVKVRVIGLTEGSILTEEREATIQPADGQLVGDASRDILPVTMVDRHGKGTGIGVGFVQGFGLKDGAIASSVSAICSNLVAVGTNAADMAIGMNHIAEMGGGHVVVRGGSPIATIELPLLGLQSQDSLNVVMQKFTDALEAIKSLGCMLTSPFSSLEFCFAGGDTPALKLSDEGLVRVRPTGGQKVGLIVD